MAVSIYYNGSNVTDATVEISLGSTATFTAVLTSGSVSRWFSSTSNDNIFTMTYSGATCTVTPVAVGTATYPLYCWDSNNTNGSVRIKVVSDGSSGETISPTGITVSPSSVTIAVSSTYTLSASVSPSNATDKTYYWTSNNSSVAAVGQSTGIVTGVSAGSARVYAYTNTGGYSDYCDVTVTGGSSSTVLPTSVTVTPSTLTLEVGQTYTLGATVYPTNATDKTYYWITGSSAVATVGRNTGVVTAIGAGTVNIYCFTNSGDAYGICAVTVTEASTSVSVSSVRVTYDGTVYSSNFSISTYVGDTISFSASVLLSNGTTDSQGVFWTMDAYGDYLSSNGSSTTAASYTAIAAGTQVVTAYSNTDTSKYVRITVNVLEETTSTTVSRVQAAYNGAVYTSSFSVTASIGDTVSISFAAILDNGSVDSEGVIHATYSSDDDIWTMTNLGSGQYSFQITASGTARLRVFSNRDTTKSIVVTITVPAQSTSSGGYSAFIYLGSSSGWVEYIPYIYNGSAWEEYEPYICPFPEETEEPVSTPVYSVTNVADSTGNNYGFALNGDGYYENQNKGYDNSYCVAAITITTPGGYNVYIDCVNYAESNYDYGILSEIGSTFALSYADETSGVKQSFKGSSMASIQTVDYGVLSAGTYTIYAKYRKDVSQSSNDDVFKFKVRFDSSGTVSQPTYTVNAVNGATYGFSMNSNGYYESQNQGQSSSYAICQVSVTTPGGYNVYVDCINYGESNFDYGILSELGSSLALSSSADSSGVKTSFKGNQSASVQTVDYGVLSAGTYSFYAKYIKDSSVDSNNDSLQFKVRFA